MLSLLYNADFSEMLFGFLLFFWRRKIKDLETVAAVMSELI